MEVVPNVEYAGLFWTVALCGPFWTRDLGIVSIKNCFA